MTFPTSTWASLPRAWSHTRKLRGPLLLLGQMTIYWGYDSEWLAVIYVIDISQTRNTLSGDANYRMVDTLYKQGALQKLLFVTTMWPAGTNMELEEARETEYKAYLHEWIKRDATSLRFNTNETAVGRDSITKALLDDAVLTDLGAGATQTSSFILINTPWSAGTENGTPAPDHVPFRHRILRWIRRGLRWHRS